MPRTSGRRRSSVSSREVFRSGPFKGVKQTTDPFDDTPDFLIDAVNMYIPDARAGSGIYARPGMALMNGSNQLGGANHMGQCVYHHTALDGTEYRFAAVSGKLYRLSSDLGIYTDVTPAGITIDPSTSTRVFMLSFADQLIVSDGVNRPWMGTNLGGTPITGTPIQYDAGNSQWCAQHMTVYSGALVFVVKSIAGVFHQTRIAWSAPNDPSQGYFNTVGGLAVDYTWDLVQTGTTPIYAIQGTNVALIYWRDYSMGALSGAIGPNFRNASTHDAIDFKIGTRAPATIALFGSTIFFCDSDGKPQMLPMGGQIVPIWLALRSVVEASRTDTPQATALTAIGAVYSSLNLYIVAIWSPNPAINLSANALYVFDTLTGQYVGRWLVGGGTNIETLGVVKDGNGQPQLVVIGTKVPAISLGFGGYVWRLTNPHENVWTDNGVILPSVQTQRMAFAADLVRYADRATAIVGSPAPCTLTALSPSTQTGGFPTADVATEALDTLITESGDTLDAEDLQSITGSPSGTSLDGTYRIPWGLDIEGRGIQLTVQPTTGTEQWRLHEIELQTVASQAAPEEM